MMKKKVKHAVLALGLVLSLFACTASNMASTQTTESTTQVTTVQETTAQTEAAAGQKSFVDSSGREIMLPDKVEKIAVTGPMTQIYVYALAPDKLVGIAREWDKGAEAYIPEKYLSLPVLGQLYGGKGEMNKEELVKADPDIVIDIGQTKEGIAEDLDALTEQTGVPFVHIAADLKSSPESFRSLGILLGMETEAESLAVYLDEVLARTETLMQTVGDNKKKILYITGAEGKNVIAKGAYHAEVLDMMGDNLALVDEPSSKGDGSAVDMEYLLTLDPEFILFAPGSIYATVGEDAAFAGMSAIAEGNYYEAPALPYNFMGFPPSVQRYLGMMWLGELLYPEQADYDLEESIRSYYKLFYHTDLTTEMYQDLMKNALPEN